MNINPILEKAFANFEVDGLLIPIAPNIYKGAASTYLTYYTWNTQPELSVDDKPSIIGTYGTIDIYSKGNFKNIIIEVRKKIEEIGFTWTGTSAEDYEEDTGLYHIPIEFCVESKDII